MSSAYKLLPQYTYEDYIQWKGRWELIDGIPYAMAPMPVPKHQWVAGNVHAVFRAALKNAGCGCKVYQPIDYKLSEDTIFNPDLLIVCQPITKKFLDFTPNLVVEILSEGTAIKDRFAKYAKYEGEGIPYYLIIDAETQTVEVYKLAMGKYQRQAVDQGQPYEVNVSDCYFTVLFQQVWE